MPKALADLGRASPALNQNWQNILGENRARRQEAMQGEEMAMRREQFQQQKALTDISLQKEQMALDAQKKQEAWLNEPMDITTHPTFMQLSQETQNKVKQDFVSQKITDPTGRGTRRDILKQVEMMEKTPKILDQYLTVEMNSRHNDVLKANEVLQKKLLEKDAKPQDVQKLQDAFDMANQKYTGLLKNRKDYMEAMEWKQNIDATTGEIKRLQSEGKLGEIPESVKQSMFMSLKTGDLKSVNEILKEWAKNELRPAPQEKPKTIPSAGNAVDLAIKRKFGSDYLIDPKLSGEADRWLNTKEGRQAVQQARDDLTPPSYTFPVTSEGIMSAQTRGAGAGKISEPTGFKKPLSDTQLSKVGELNSVLKNIGKTKELYGYGTKKEHTEWVGPVAGRAGSVQTKYLGTASPEQVKFYSYVKDMQDALLRARSGAQINEQEYARLVAFLPDPNLPPASFKAKLERFEEATQIVMDERLSAFEKGGVGVGGIKKSQGVIRGDGWKITPLPKK